MATWNQQPRRIANIVQVVIHTSITQYLCRTSSINFVPDKYAADIDEHMRFAREAGVDINKIRTFLSSDSDNESSSSGFTIGSPAIRSPRSFNDHFKDTDKHKSGTYGEDSEQGDLTTDRRNSQLWKHSEGGIPNGTEDEEEG